MGAKLKYKRHRKLCVCGASYYYLAYYYLAYIILNLTFLVNGDIITSMEFSGKYLRPCKYDCIKNLHGTYHKNERSLRFEIIAGGIITPGDVPRIWNSCVFTPQGTPSSYAAEEYDIEGIPSMPEDEIRYSDERVLYAGYLNPHWGHFLMDSLPQLWGAFSEEFPEFDKIIFTAPQNWDESIPSNITETLRLSGLYDKIEVISRPVKYASIIVPEKGIVACERVGKEILAVFDAIAANAMNELNSTTSAYSKRIFFSRRAFKKACKNEPGSEWLDTLFAANGFEIVYPEKTGAGEMIRMIRNADIIATLSGTIPHNMMFAKDGQKLWIIEKSPLVNKYQEGVNLCRKLDVFEVDANAQIWSVSFGSGPFIIYPNEIFMRFASDNSLREVLPWSDKKKRCVLRHYFRQYKRLWGYEWVLDKWDEAEISSLREAYRDSIRDFGKWLSGEKPLTISDAFSPRLFVKNIFSKFRK